MTRREEQHERRPDAATHQAAEPAPAPAPAPSAAVVLALQRSAGNRVVAGMLARHEDDAPTTGGGATTGAPAALTQAAQEAEALETWGLLRGIHQEMLAHTDVRISNTAQMLDPPAEGPQGHRMSVKPMTLRSDSAQLVAARGENPAQDAYFFYGSRQDNEHKHGPTTLGTIEGGTTVIVRGRRSSGAWQTHERIMGALVHECSHILVKDYGEHAATGTDAASFDRYRDEFRAYFVEPHGNFEGITDPTARATAIKDHLVGTSATVVSSYPELHAAYWAQPLTGNVFHQQVDGHTRPDGFNVTNSPRLDRLVSLLREQRAGRAGVDDTIFQISVLSAAERQEAAGATLIVTLLGRLDAADADAIRRALASPAAVGYGREMNPNDSPRVTAFLTAVAAKAPDEIVGTYRACNPQDRADLHFNEHVLTWIGVTLPNELLMRTCVTCMITGRSFAYFDRVRMFAQACTAAAGASEMPEALRSALRDLSLDVRMGYYRFCEDAYRVHVEPLQEPVRRQVRAILRGDAEP